MNTNPAPYVPPQQGQVLPDRAYLKPWQHRRPGETTEQFQDRTSHSCWKCGREIRDMATLDTHETTCRGETP